MGCGESVRGSATAWEESPRLNTKNSTGSPVEAAAAQLRARGRLGFFRTVVTSRRPVIAEHGRDGDV